MAVLTATVLIAAVLIVAVLIAAVLIAAVLITQLPSRVIAFNSYVPAGVRSVCSVFCSQKTKMKKKRHGMAVMRVNWSLCLLSSI